MTLIYVTSISTHHASKIFSYVEVIKAVQFQIGGS